MKKNNLLLLLLLLGNLIASSQIQKNQTKSSNTSYKTVHLELIDHKYKQLSMIASSYKSKDKEYKGKSTDGRNWIFKIPDSVFRKALGVCFRNFESDDNEAVKGIELCYIQQKDTFMSPNSVNFNDVKNINLKLKYIKREIYKLYRNDSTGVPKLTNYITDFYVVQNPDIETILSIREGLSFCWFGSKKNTNKSYKDFLTEYIELVKQHPDSKILLSMLLKRYDGGRFNAGEDIQLLYDAFSIKMKNTYIGKIIKEKLSTVTSSSRFENLKLPNSSTHQIEPIISDSTKFNLVVFSASWCLPCHKLIPLLKQINDDLHQNLNLIYISVDAQITVKQWENFLQEKNITWRSLSAYDNLELVKNKFLAYAIPKSWLVYPDGKMEVIDIKKTSDKEKLYKLVMNR